MDPDGPVAAHRPDLGPCWRWGGPVGHAGYGEMWWRGRKVHAHRIAWELAWGAPPPAGMPLAHFACDLRSCPNPAHVRPAGAVEDVLGRRGVAAWNGRHSHCLRGHPLTARNSIFVPGGIACRECRAEVARARRR